MPFAQQSFIESPLFANLGGRDAACRGEFPHGLGFEIKDLSSFVEIEDHGPDPTRA